MQAIDLAEVIKITGLSRSTIYGRGDPHSRQYDPSFPKKFSLGGDRVGWDRDEVYAWLRKCAEQAKQGRSRVRQPPAASRPDAEDSKSGSQAKRKKPANFANIGEAIVAGVKQNQILLHFLEMPSWTPHMGAMLLAGIQPPTDCLEFPVEAKGIDGRKLGYATAEFATARAMLKLWQDWEFDDAAPDQLHPLAFLHWCLNEAELNLPWMEVMLLLVNCPRPSAAAVDASILAARIAPLKFTPSSVV
jgi:predicted DNA-binding transcriptional regulator AlpA